MSCAVPQKFALRPVEVYLNALFTCTVRPQFRRAAMNFNPFRMRKTVPEADAASFTSALLSAVQGTRAPAATDSYTYAASRGAEPEVLFTSKKPRTVACIVTHGMGQQPPFETVGSIAE